MLVFKKKLPKQSQLRAAITKAYCMDETQCVNALMAQLEDFSTHKPAVAEIATDLVKTVRQKETAKGGLEALMAHYDLSSEEGILLMCLAEALLRIPDKDTEDLLIKDKLTSANWKKHLGVSESRFVNMATWSLAFTGKVLKDPSSGFFSKVWHGLVTRCGEPVIRESVRHAMKLMSEHYVLGRTIKEALKRSEPLAKKGYLFSYDMLGEMARTKVQADDYYIAYQKAIDALGASREKTVDAFKAPSISVKLSALDPRYEFAQCETTVPFLIERLKSLALQAQSVDVHLTVDAEESYRLDISLDIIEAVFTDPDLGDWEGLGLAVQAYQKRAYAVLEWLIALSREHKKRIPVRLVKGAYWDTEIKLAQVEGFAGYPVFTRKASTDVCYLACAQLLLTAQDAIYPKFATHNAYTIASILWMTKGKSYEYEFQNLQGMGGPLHDLLVFSDQYHAPSRIYAPVGKHEDLLPYLVRRLLENGANTSFVHQIGNPEVPIDVLTRCPMDIVASLTEIPQPKIPLPAHIFPDGRKNSHGFDFTRIDELHILIDKMIPWETHTWQASPFNRGIKNSSATKKIVNPNNHKDVVGEVVLGSAADVDAAFCAADKAFFDWDQLGMDQRATLLEKTADLMEQSSAEFFVLLTREAGKVFSDAVAEVREAVDFCRYYARIARDHLSPMTMPGPTGELNVLRMGGRGTMVCVSPWNFPLAIFTGQMAASLVTGNCVIAKPAGQTPLVAAKAVSLFYEAGVPKAVLQLMPGPGGEVGQALMADERTAGVLFTGSTETAKHIQHTLADKKGPIVPFIAETGGINAMIVDSSALLEQLVGDVMISAFGSVGQRCSALRVVFVQSDIADDFNAMLKGAMATWHVGPSDLLATDVGPVIDRGAQQMLQSHIDEMKKSATLIAQVNLPDHTQQGTFISPSAFEIPSLADLQKEVFGPVLHVVRYERKNLDKVIDDINALGYGLTFGIQSRIDQTIDYIQKRIKAGNIYVNRTMIGAVVGVQPFGGCGLSGTGPKAGGPHYLARLCQESTLTIDTTAAGGNAQLLVAEEE